MKTIILFFKYPKVGKVKTRLGKEIGFKKACLIYQQLLSFRLESLYRLPKTYQIYFYIDQIKGHFLKKISKQMTDFKKKCFKQTGNNLGEKMALAFKNHLIKPSDKVVIIGSDIPFISHAILNKAFRLLETKDLVLGPTQDGGYYLIGLRKSNKQLFSLFKGISWSNEQVLSQTITQSKKNKINFSLLPKLFDIDNKEDLEQLYAII